MKMLHLQQANTTSGRYDVHEKVPYPLFVHLDGAVDNPEILGETEPLRLAGFQNDADVHHVDLHWRDMVTEPQKAIGKFPVFIGGGTMFVHTLPIDAAFEFEAKA